MIGQTILGYTIEEEIGSGGFGTVYKVSKKNRAGTYIRALKHISLPSKKQYNDVLNSMGGDYSKADNYFADILNEIVHEIQILNDLTEKGVRNVVWYYENQIDEHRSPLKYDIYILMEYLTPLPEHIEKNDFKLRDVIKLGKDILSALIECHKNNIIHRDIKEDNIFIANDGTYKLGDFGVSKKLQDRSRAESMKGTPNYIAPEIYLGKDKYDSTVDLYSLGIVLYKLLNYNRNPFLPNYPALYNSEDEDRAFEERMKGSVPPLPLNASEELGQVIVRAIMPSNSRYKSAKEFYDSLEKIESKITNEELNKVIIKCLAREDDSKTQKSIEKQIQVPKETISDTYDLNEKKDTRGNGDLFETQREYTHKSISKDEVNVIEGGDFEYKQKKMVEEPKLNNIQKDSLNWLLYIVPVIIVLIYIILFFVLIPISYDNAVSFIDLAIKNPNELLEMIKSSDNVVPHIYKMILLKIVNYILFGALIVSLYFIGRKLHFSRPQYSSDATVFDKEAYYLAMEIFEELKSLNISNTRDIIESVKTVQDRLKNDSGFGVGNPQIIRCEKEIGNLLSSINDNIPGLQNKSTFETAKKSILSSCRKIMAKLKIRTELKKR